MKNIIAIILGILCLFGAYCGVRSGAWADMVASLFMEMSYQTIRCNKYIAAQENIDLVEKNHLKEYVTRVCPIDKDVCDKVDIMRKEYEISRTQFLSHNWMPFFKHMLYGHK